jgi:hypothetical protein
VKLLDGLGRLALLSKAFSRLDVLDDPLVESVRAEVGISLPQEEVLERGERVDDRWIVLGQRTEEEGRLTVRRTWLLGEDTRRYALVLQFAAAGSPFAEGFVSGTKWRGELAFYPGAYPLRAVVRSRSGGGDRCEGLPGHDTVEAFLDHTSKATALQPWLERLPAALRGVVPLLDGVSEGGRWLITLNALPGPWDEELSLLYLEKLRKHVPRTFARNRDVSDPWLGTPQPAAERIALSCLDHATVLQPDEVLPERMFSDGQVLRYYWREKLEKFEETLELRRRLVKEIPL